MTPAVTYHDGTDHILKFTVLSETDWHREFLPKPHTLGTGETLAACAKLGSATDATELIHCPTCRGNVRQKFPVHNCQVHGACLPTYIGTDTEKMTCHRCQRERLGYTPLVEIS